MKVTEIQARRAALDADPEADNAYCGLYRGVLTDIANSCQYPAAAKAKAALGLPLRKATS